jgi:protein KRI1
LSFHVGVVSCPPASLSMAKLLDFDGSESEDGGVQLAGDSDFKVNQDFAKRYTFTKKREELRRCKSSYTVLFQTCT